VEGNPGKKVAFGEEGKTSNRKNLEMKGRRLDAPKEATIGRNPI